MTDGAFHLAAHRTGALIHAVNEIADPIRGFTKPIAGLAECPVHVLSEPRRKVANHVSQAFAPHLADALGQRLDGLSERRSDSPWELLS